MGIASAVGKASILKSDPLDKRLALLRLGAPHESNVTNVCLNFPPGWVVTGFKPSLDQPGSIFIEVRSMDLPEVQEGETVRELEGIVESRSFQDETGYWVAFRFKQFRWLESREIAWQR